MTKLVILESPTKTKAVEKYLGPGYTVVSSEGHVRNLSTKGEHGLGVDLNNFTPLYKVIHGKGKKVKELQKIAKKAEVVYLATDPDREGEAIAYHLNEVLNCDDRSVRVRFNEITKEAILDAFKKPTEIDMDLVESQTARRILDRFIGFRLSKLIQQKIKSKSAGRVQSVALKIIVEREKEYSNFVPKEYWVVEGKYKRTSVKLTKYLGNKIELENEQQVLDIKNNTKNSYIVEDIKEVEKKRNSPYPHTTSTLLQESSSKLGFASNKTSMIAQQLYEGIKIDKELTGFITYPRTDSTRLSDNFLEDAFTFIRVAYGPDYIGEVKPPKGKKKNVQDAHEAIRPTNLSITPEKAKEYLSRDQLRVYKIIYNKTLASLMPPAKLLGKSIILNNNGYEFRMTGSTVLFDGFLKCQDLDDEDKVVRLPKIKVGDEIVVDEMLGLKRFTKPRNRYSEARIIKELEDIGVGRPSTYAPILRTLKERGYIVVENKAIKATEKGILTSDKLQEYFNDIINESYTSIVEEELDEIADGNVRSFPLLKDFWDLFEPRIQNAMVNMEEIPIEKANIICPECGFDLVYRYGKYGKFIACSTFPKCRYIHQTGPKFGPCTECGVGEILLKFNKRGQKFKACSRYPDCNFTDTYRPEKPDEASDETEVKIKQIIIHSNNK
ncbi:type I DNA topoisomerase [Spiroplasma endosymbiont of Anurida maritima]|uniref:type I DNA topoisomerase n=1 Tax=Spiroplasma endosymbiont of Anurida maritima TaxID=2967972 RepID=UPI0036D40333